MLKKFTVWLTEEEEGQLREMVARGTGNARVIRRAHTLLLARDGHTDEAIRTFLHVAPETVAKTRQRFKERGMQSVYDKPRPGRARKLDGPAEAHLVALACSDPPEGHARWTMQLLADQMVVLGKAKTLSDETVRRVLKNKPSSRG